jgi:hypothetical protein
MAVTSTAMTGGVGKESQRAEKWFVTIQRIRRVTLRFRPALPELTRSTRAIHAPHGERGATAAVDGRDKHGHDEGEE